MKNPQLQYLPIDDLLPYARNAKLHPPEQILQIAASIKEFGFNAPVLVDGENGIIAGHGRVLAARKLGLTTVPCIVLDHLTEAQKRAYIIADNRIGDSDLAPWDWDMLQAELDSLKEENYDYTLTGFTDESLAAAVGSVCQALESDESSSSAPIKMTMAERFGIPPFSVLNAREGWWQARKQAWIALGIQSELGRGMENINMAHPETTSTIDFYSQKRKLESKLGRELTKDEAAQIIDDSGGLKNQRAINKARAGGADMDIAGNQRKRAELLPQPNATPGGSLMPAMNYSAKQRGDGRGRPL